MKYIIKYILFVVLNIIEEGRIRTYVELTIDLQSIAFNHSATSSILFIFTKTSREVV